MTKEQIERRVQDLDVLKHYGILSWVWHGVVQGVNREDDKKAAMQLHSLVATIRDIAARDDLRPKLEALIREVKD